MNPVESLQQRLRVILPDARIEVDAPADAAGTWWVDVFQPQHQVSLGWRDQLGFGVSAGEDGGVFGDGHDEVFADADAAIARVIELARNKGTTRAPRAILLRRLREVRQITQERLAYRLGIKQASISKLERRTDIYVSTLRNVVAALGGQLEIRARFPEGVVRLLQVGDIENSSATVLRETPGGDEAMFPATTADANVSAPPVAVDTGRTGRT